MIKINPKGFTLLEIALAVVLMSLVMMVFFATIMSAQKFCTSMNFEISIKRQALLAVNAVIQDLEYAIAEQMYPLQPLDSPYLEFKKLKNIADDGSPVWDAKIRWEFRTVKDGETGEIIRLKYADDDKSVVESKVVARHVLPVDPETSLHGISFTKEGRLLHVAITIRHHDGKGYLLRVHHKIAICLR